MAAIAIIYRLTRSRGSRCISMSNIVKICQSVAKILRFFYFSRWRLPPFWIIKFVIFYWLTLSGRPRRITVPNFVKIGRSVVEILRFLKILRRPPPFYSVLSQKHFCQKLPKSVDASWSYIVQHRCVDTQCTHSQAISSFLYFREFSERRHYNKPMENHFK